MSASERRPSYGYGAFVLEAFVESQHTVQQVPLLALAPAPWNPRGISDARFQNLCASLEADPDFLELRPVLATLDGTILAGNMRYRAAQHLGWEWALPLVSGQVAFLRPHLESKPLTSSDAFSEN